MGRGLIANAAGTQLFTVCGNKAYSVAPNGDRTEIGSLITRRGHVGMRLGLNQLVVTDGANGYVYDLLTKAWTQIDSEGWLGSYTVESFGGYFVFVRPNSQQFYVSALEDATTLDPIDFFSANASPDKLVGQCKTGNVIVVFGEVSGEVWQLDDSGQEILVRNTGATLQAGLLAPFTAKEMDNSIYWLGRDERGAGFVYRLEGLRAVRISNMALEEKVQAAIAAGHDVGKASAYAYQQKGHSFYCLSIPGLETTWCFDAATGQWAERGETVNGDWVQHRGLYAAYAFGKHLVLDADDYIYQLDPNAYTNAGDPLVRCRISPHNSNPNLKPISFISFELDCTVGVGKPDGSAAKALLRYSNDGGHDWAHQPWREATLGAVGNTTARARWLRCGRARDRVWEVRISDPVPVSINDAVIEASS